MLTLADFALEQKIQGLQVLFADTLRILDSSVWVEREPFKFMVVGSNPTPENSCSFAVVFFFEACNTVQCSHCNTVQHSATHPHTVQHSATASTAGRTNKIYCKKKTEPCMQRGQTGCVEQEMRVVRCVDWCEFCRLQLFRLRRASPASPAACRKTAATGWHPEGCQT